MERLMKLILIVAVVNYLAVSAFAVIDEEDMIGIWIFDEGNGKEVRDFSGNENDGEIFGQVEWVEGKDGKAIEFLQIGKVSNIKHTRS